MIDATAQYSFAVTFQARGNTGEPEQMSVILSPDEVFDPRAAQRQIAAKYGLLLSVASSAESWQSELIRIANPTTAKEVADADEKNQRFVDSLKDLNRRSEDEFSR